MQPTFKQYLNAGYPALWVQTHEEARAISALKAEAGDEYNAFAWDLMSGTYDLQTGASMNNKDPVKAVQSIQALPENSIIFLKDFHKFFKSIEVVRTFKNALAICKSSCRHMIIVSPVVDIPIELEKDITVYEFSLPSVDDLHGLAEKIVSENGLEITVDHNTMEAAKGLTMEEAENAITLSIVRSGKIEREVLETEKLQTIKKIGLMEIHPPVDISQLGGLEGLKRYITARKEGIVNAENRNRAPKGILLVGLPGGGKSLSAKVIASILDLHLIRLDISSLKGSLVGESERKMRQATSIIDAVSPAVVWLDEIEKSLSGVQSSGRTDGGTTDGMFGHFLTWMSESQSTKYIVATCNNISTLLEASQGALIRRFDDVFFVDLPSLEERKQILAIMNKRYDVKCKCDIVAQMEGWTGAEIEKFVVASFYDGIDEAMRNIHPIYHQNRNQIDALREWAVSNARMANTGNEETRQTKPKAVRRVK